MRKKIEFSVLNDEHYKDGENVVRLISPKIIC